MPKVAEPKSDRYGGISSASVEKATGRGWEEWLKVLDRDGAADMSHAEIAAHLAETHGVPLWWSQMVTVGYEQARGRRVKHQAADGFQCSGSKTMGVSARAISKAWTDEGVRERWLPGADLEIRKATAGKSIRITWEPGKKASDLSVMFYPKGKDKAQVTVDHKKLPSLAAANKLKRYWKERLGALQELLEG